jgi:glutaredoxin 3
MAEVIIYTSDACPYCVRAKRLLDHKGVQYEQIHIALDDFDARLHIAEITGHMTVPQIIIDGKPIGGWDQLSALDRAGQLDPLLNGGDRVPGTPP